MVKELLIGDNPFLGVSHLSQEKAHQESHETTLDNIVRVVEASVDSGASGFTFSAHPTNLKLLKHLRDHRRDLLDSLDYYILAPYAQTYVRKANERGTPALVKSILAQALRKHMVLELAKATLTIDIESYLGILLETEISPFMEVLPRNRVKAILLHEAVTELVIAFRLDNILEHVCTRVKSRLGVDFGLETRNFGQLSAFIEETSPKPKFVMTPFNSLGYQMAPDRQTVENALVKQAERAKIIAINILASGALTLTDAGDYLSKFTSHLHAVVSATIRPERARQNFLTLTRSFLS